MSLDQLQVFKHFSLDVGVGFQLEARYSRLLSEVWRHDTRKPLERLVFDDVRSMRRTALYDQVIGRKLLKRVAFPLERASGAGALVIPTPGTVRCTVSDSFGSAELLIRYSRVVALIKPRRTSDTIQKTGTLCNLRESESNDFWLSKRVMRAVHAELAR